jgi:large subunit ribosomal protein L1
MSRVGKKYANAREKVDRSRYYSLEEAIETVKSIKFAGFDESVDMAVKLGVNPKHSDQIVRGTVVLPHGTGKTKRVLVFAQGEKEIEAKEAGADHVGGDDMIEKITEGWLEFDAAIATPDIMSKVGKLGKVLGPRGLMPNPKTGTVTFDVGRAVQEVKAGKIEFRVDKTGIVHAPVGKISFDAENLKQNVKVLLEAVIKAKPATAKGRYLRSITLSSTMGPGVKLDPVQVANLF